MQFKAKPTATDDPDFVLVPSDQVRVAPSDAEITHLLRAAARRSEPGSNANSNAPAPANTSGSAGVPAVDTTFRATAVNDDVVPRRSTTGRRVMRAVAALLLAAGIGGAAVGWQFFGYAAKKAVGKWLPQLALTTSISLDQLGLGNQSQPAEPAAPEETSASAAPSASTQAVSEGAPASAVAPDSDTTQSRQSMARDLANLSQEVETLKATIAELKASQQQMLRDRAAEQAAKPKPAAPPPHPAVAARKPAPVYSPTPTPLPPAPAYRPASPYPPAQAAVAPPPPAAQPYVQRPVEPPPIPLQPQAEQPGLSSVPRPPLPVVQ